MSDWSVSDVEEVMPILNDEQFEEREAIKQHEEQLDQMEEEDFIDFEEELVELKPNNLEWKQELEAYLRKDLTPVEVYYCQCLCVLIQLIDEGVAIQYHPIIDLMVKIKKHMNKQNKKKKKSSRISASNVEEVIKEHNEGLSNEDSFDKTDELNEFENNMSEDELSEMSGLESIHSDQESINFDDLVQTDDEESEVEAPLVPQNNNYKRMINNVIKNQSAVHVDLETVQHKSQPKLNDQVGNKQLQQLDQDADQFSSSDEEDTFENKLDKLQASEPTLKVKEMQRNINYAILKNRQFKTGKRSINSNPRVRKKAKFAKANKKIKSMHAVYQGKQNYQGELTGINDKVVKSVSFK